LAAAERDQPGLSGLRLADRLDPHGLQALELAPPLEPGALDHAGDQVADGLRLPRGRSLWRTTWREEPAPALMPLVHAPFECSTAAPSLWRARRDLRSSALQPPRSSLSPRG